MKNWGNIEGKGYGNFTIVESLGVQELTHNVKKTGRPVKRLFVKARCKCGTENKYMFSQLVRGHPKSCGCIQVEAAHERENLRVIPRLPKFDHTGRRFGKLTVIGFSHSTRNAALWNLQCDCGRFVKRTIRSTMGDHSQCNFCLSDELRDKNEAWKGKGTVPRSFYVRAKHGAIRRDIAFDITLHNLEDLLEKQQGLCSLTGTKLIVSNDRNLNNASIDRIDSAVGYQPSNIQWVHKDINYIKRSLSNEKLLYWCKLVAQHTGSI